MPSITLTDIAIRAFTVPEVEQVTYWDEGLSGFGVRVSRGGTKSFVLVYGPTRQRTTIGRYPTLSLKEARTQAKRLIAEKTLGISQHRTEITYADARAKFLDASRQKNRTRTTDDYRQRLDRHFKFGRKRLREISRTDIQNRLAKLSGTPSERHHAFVAIRTLFNWALREQLIKQSPMTGMQPPKNNPPRERVLTDEELGIVLQAAQAHPFPFGPIVQLLILIGQRRGETAALRWDWIDQEAQLITIPAEVTKNGRTHTFPYGDLAAKVIAELPVIGDHLFPSRTTNGTIFNGWSKSKARFDKALDIEPYTLHDLRRTFSSNLARLGTPIYVTEKLLNHVSGTVSGVAAVYNRYSYQKEMTDALAQYEAQVSEIVSKNHYMTDSSPSEVGSHSA